MPIGKKNLSIAKFSGIDKPVPVLGWRAAGMFPERSEKVRIVPVTGPFHDFVDGKIRFPEERAGGLYPQTADIFHDGDAHGSFEFLVQGRLVCVKLPGDSFHGRLLCVMAVQPVDHFPDLIGHFTEVYLFVSFIFIVNGIYQEQ